MAGTSDPSPKSGGSIHIGWEPALAVAIGTFLAAFAALGAAVASSPTAQVGWLDTRLVSLLFGLPAAASAAGLIAALFARWNRPKVGLAAGVLAAVVVALIVGAGSADLAQWWISDLPTDSNRTASYLSISLAFLSAFPVAIVVASALQSLSDGHSGQPARFLGALGAVVGVLSGAAIGALVGGIQQVLDCDQVLGCTYPPQLFSAMESGGALGAWAGLPIGAAAGLAAWIIVFGGRPSTASAPA